MKPILLLSLLTLTVSVQKAHSCATYTYIYENNFSGVVSCTGSCYQPNQVKVWLINIGVNKKVRLIYDVDIHPSSSVNIYNGQLVNGTVNPTTPIQTITGYDRSELETDSINGLCVVVFDPGVGSGTSYPGIEIEYLDNEYYYEFEDYTEEEMSFVPGPGQDYAPYGWDFTPKGDLRVLIICAGFGAPYDNYAVSGWAEGSNTFPTCLTDPTQRPFYSNPSDFNNPLPIDGVRNISRYYYEMSGGQFRLMADLFPHRINIDASDITETDLDGWFQINLKVLETMKTQYPNFDWSPYDKRKNKSRYLFDSSDVITNPSDNKPDYVVFLYRFALSGWPQYPISGMEKWRGGAIGNSRATIYPKGLAYNGYTFDKGSGYIHYASISDFSEIFIHETAHNIYNCPHYANANGVAGYYFYGQNGWGAIKHFGWTPFACANGWERWYLDWIENIEANGVNTDIKSATDLNPTGEYTLRDYLTTGDVLRLKIPNGTGKNQYLWLENHQGLSIFGGVINRMINYFHKFRFCNKMFRYSIQSSCREFVRSLRNRLFFDSSALGVF